jgi:hypothetical protein
VVGCGVEEVGGGLLVVWLMSIWVTRHTNFGSERQAPTAGNVVLLLVELWDATLSGLSGGGELRLVVRMPIPPDHVETTVWLQSRTEAPLNRQYQPCPMGMVAV